MKQFDLFSVKENIETCRHLCDKSFRGKESIESFRNFLGFMSVPATPKYQGFFHVVS